MREVKVVRPTVREERYYQNLVQPIIMERYLQLMKKKEDTGIINQEFYLRAIQQLMNEEALPIITYRMDYDPTKDEQLKLTNNQQSTQASQSTNN
jgi:epoxyqueuosine reductase QueG